MKVNINDSVKFKLTDEGLKILNDPELFPSNRLDFLKSMRNNEGYIICEFWRFIQLIGGENIYHGRNPLTEDNCFELIDVINNQIQVK